MCLEREREWGWGWGEEREMSRQRETGFLVGMRLGLIGNKGNAYIGGKEIAETCSQIKKMQEKEGNRVFWGRSFEGKVSEKGK